MLEIERANFYFFHRDSNFSSSLDTYSEVYDIQEDLFFPSNLLFSDGHALLTASGNTSHLVAGKIGSWGYNERQGEQARFYGITGILQINSTTAIVVDKWNHCLRSIDRLTNQTSLYAGNCTDYGKQEGELSVARFSYPTDIIQVDKVIVITDTYNMAVRAIIPSQGKHLVTTVSKAGILKYPKYLAANTANDIFVTVNDGLIKISAGTNEPVALTSLQGGYLDGAMSVAQFYAIDQVQLLHDRLMIVTDAGNRQLRLIDLQNDTVVTISELPNKICRGVLVTDAKIYIGGYKHIYEAAATGEIAEPCIYTSGGGGITRGQESGRLRLFPLLPLIVTNIER